MVYSEQGSRLRPSIRVTNLIVFSACVIAVLITVFYFQKTLGLTPCPLCVTQRAFVIAIGIIALVAFIHHPGAGGIKVYAGLGAIAAIGGGCVSARHIWLQNLPEELVPACGPGLSFILETMPLWEAIKVLFQGDGDCADVVWTLFGVSIPGWTLVAFIGFTLINVWQLFRKA
ncbi:disulfide bond formation protein B [Teredinibacter sp. KSP-S5-2]|uniref:disulfide bond formation protein B n=1 Tax=Teredinibacter sp. KSP-S5-2 TaxID=3034506 RepID=UPI002934BC8D|nr:disulfide bond formation protein B [Teredinibacter sp. KSP-S5-2]WNO10668.1 disulfide bond formation protein B [Teredinibacter sp. KSP-S5-2]